MAKSHSTVIENLCVTSEQASITLGGREIHFKADPRSIAYSAFKELQEEIEAGYLAQRAQAPENHGLLSRLGSLLGNWFRTGDSSIKRDRRKRIARQHAPFRAGNQARQRSASRRT